MIGFGISCQNRKALTMECLHAVIKFAPLGSQIVISDDASTDGTQDAIKKGIEEHGILNIKNVHLIENPNMLGISNNKRIIVDRLLSNPDLEDIILIEDDVTPIEPHWYQVFLDTAYKNAEAHLIFAPTDRKYGPVRYKTGEEPFQIEWKQYCSGMILYFRAALLREVGNFEPGFRRYGWDHNLLTAKCLLAQWRDPGGPYPHCLAAETQNVVRAMDIEAAKSGRAETSTCGDVVVKMRMAGENKQLYEQRLSEMRVKYSELEKRSDQDKLAQRLRYFKGSWTMGEDLNAKVVGPCF